jgi:hypothetical protein
MARHAFVWGSNASAAFGKLKYARDDAQRFSRTLAGARYGFKVVAPTKPGDPYQIKKELDRLAKGCTQDDSFVFFFSGHGELVGGELMLVLDDTVPGDETTYLPVGWVKEARARCAANNRLIILDCCHAGGAVGAKAGGAIDIAELGLESKTELMLLASRRLEIARELAALKGSFLTSAMCDFLDGAEGAVVGLGQLMAHLHKSARAHNQAAAGGVAKVPIPFLNGDQQGEFLFTGLRYPDLSRFVTIRDQGEEGSPASLAVVTAMETSLAAQGVNLRLSPRYLREKSRSAGEQGEGDIGESFAPVIFIVEHFGLPPESIWPYVAGDPKLPKGMTFAKMEQAASRQKAVTYRLRSLDEVTAQLQLNRPVVVAVLVHGANGWLEGTLGKIRVPAPAQVPNGLHCITIVARTEQGYRFANSWGAAWGDRGFGEMTEAAARAIVQQNDMWAIEVPVRDLPRLAPQALPDERVTTKARRPVKRGPAAADRAPRSGPRRAR